MKFIFTAHIKQNTAAETINVGVMESFLHL